MLFKPILVITSDYQGGSDASQAVETSDELSPLFHPQPFALIQPTQPWTQSTQPHQPYRYNAEISSGSSSLTESSSFGDSTGVDESSRGKRKFPGLSKTTGKRVKLQQPDPVSKLMDAVGLGANFKALFSLYGVHTLADFEIFDKGSMELLQSMVQQNGFIDTVDLTSREMQLKYLGRKLAIDGLKNFRILPLDVLKITQYLPVKLAELKENEAMKSVHKSLLMEKSSLA